MTTTALVNFATTVNDAIALMDMRGRFGKRKVFISAIWDRLSSSERNGMTLADFKGHLFMAHRAQLLSLARADLVAAMDPELVAASEVDQNGATFHFVVDGRIRDTWA